MCQNHSCNHEKHNCSGSCCSPTTPHHHEDKHIVRIISFTDKVELNYSPEDKISSCYFSEPSRVIYGDCTLYEVNRFSIVNDKIYFFNEESGDAPFININLNDKIVSVYETSEKNLFALGSDLTIDEFNMDRATELNYYPKYSISINKIPSKSKVPEGYEAIIKIKASKLDEEVIFVKNVVNSMTEALSTINYFYNDSTGILHILQRISNNQLKSVFYNNKLYEILCLRNYGIEVRGKDNKENLLLPYHFLTRTECIFMNKEDYIIIDGKLYNGISEIDNCQDIIDTVNKMEQLGDSIDAPGGGIEEEIEWHKLQDGVVNKIIELNPIVKDKPHFMIYTVNGRDKFRTVLTVKGPSNTPMFNEDEVEE